MITHVSRSVQGGSRFGGDPTRPLPRAAREAVRPFVVSYAASRVAPAVPEYRVAQTTAEMLKLAILLAMFALLNGGDLVSTYAGLHSGMHEGNPLMSGLLEHYGFGAMIGYKLLVVFAVSAGVVLLRTFSKGIATATIWACNALVCAVVVMNVLQFVTR